MEAFEKNIFSRWRPNKDGGHAKIEIFSWNTNFECLSDKYREIILIIKKTHFFYQKYVLHNPLGNLNSGRSPESEAH